MLIDGHYGLSDTFDARLHVLDAGDENPGIDGDGAHQKSARARAPREGAVYSVVGSSSKNVGHLYDHPVMTSRINYEGSMVIDINGPTLEAVFIDMDGAQPDRFQIQKVPEPRSLCMQAIALAMIAAGARRSASRCYPGPTAPG
jgi:hypothetical protein